LKSLSKIDPGRTRKRAIIRNETAAGSAEGVWVEEK
jgi:hypothetical protein